MAGKEPPALPNREPTERDLELARLSSRFALIQAAIDKLGFAVGVASFGVPGAAVVETARALAGKTTTVNLGITIALTISVAGLGTGFWKMWRKSRAQAAELERLRKRVQDLEQQLLAAKEPGD
jgi:hypothetical protein